MALPTILFNASTGSDVAASGAGPGTALTGTAASFAASVVTLDGTPDLSGVATDGSHALWLKTSTGRQFFKITAKDDGADTVTVADAPAGTATGRTWGIGGKRATFADADSAHIFPDAKAGWTIQTETDQAISAFLACTGLGDTTNGLITIQGDSATTHRIITQSANAAILASLNNWTVKNLHFKCSNGSKSSSYGIYLDDGNCVWLNVSNCIFGDATNKLGNGVVRVGGAQPMVAIIDCEFKNCTVIPIQTGGGQAKTIIADCWIHDNEATAGIYIMFHHTCPCVIEGNIIENNVGDGIRFESGGSNTAVPYIRNNTIDANTGDGLDIAGVENWPCAMIVGNNFTRNGNYGIRGVSPGDALKALLNFNNFGTGALVNASGAVTGVTAGANDLTVDPGYTNSGSNDYSVGTGVKAKGWPDSTKTIGAGKSATYSYVDIGAGQRQESGPKARYCLGI